MVTDVELSSWIIKTEQRMDALEERVNTDMERKIEALQQRVSDLRDELHSTERNLNSRIDDERSDRERADDSVKSDVESLRHDVLYGR